MGGWRQLKNVCHFVISLAISEDFRTFSKKAAIKQEQVVNN